jgi:hypothetical protein
LNRCGQIVEVPLSVLREENRHRHQPDNKRDGRAWQQGSLGMPGPAPFDGARPSPAPEDAYQGIKRARRGRRGLPRSRSAARRAGRSPPDTHASRAARRAEVTVGSAAEEPRITMLQSEGMGARPCSAASGRSRDPRGFAHFCPRESAVRHQFGRFRVPYCPPL